MDLALILIAFGFGFGANLARLPPMVGYLAAGFVMYGFGYEITAAISLIGDVGVLLLLFGIGLKLRLKTLSRPAVWAGASIHAVCSTAFFGGALLAIGATGLPLASELTVAEAALVGFAFSFSSTVFAVKALEERGEASSIQGRLAIGILVVQDIFAVVFLTFTVDETPSIWAIAVVAGVFALRPVYGWLLDRAGHGELLLLFGLAMAVGVGAESFDRVGLKPDLGALLIGLAMAGHRRSSELAATLLGFKDILLIGFFLSIGLAGPPDLAATGVAVIVVILVPLKVAGFMWLVARFRFRIRSAWHTAITLGTYSEFGLIVAVVGVERELIDPQWGSAIGVAVALSFALASPVNSARYLLYGRLSHRLARFERSPIQNDDALLEPSGAQIIVFGMGRVGVGAYDELVIRRGPVVLGIDHDERNVEANTSDQRSVIRGDALDVEFWNRLQLHDDIRLVVLAMNDHKANVAAVHRIREFLPKTRIAAIATYPDEVDALSQAGVDIARNLYGEAGQGLADDACDVLFRS